MGAYLEEGRSREVKREIEEWGCGHLFCGIRSNRQSVLRKRVKVENTSSTCSQAATRRTRRSWEHTDNIWIICELLQRRNPGNVIAWPDYLSGAKLLRPLGREAEWLANPLPQLLDLSFSAGSSSAGEVVGVAGLLYMCTT